MRVARSLMIVLAALMLAAPIGNVDGAAATVSVAASLSIQVVPPALPADAKTHAAVVVSLLDRSGQQTVALNDTQVYLTSSQEDVAKIQGTASIPAGHSYVVANVTDTLTPGNTTITASSVGLGSAFGSLRTAIPSGFPASLAIFASPPVQPLGKSNSGQLVIEILDQLGRPTRAATAVPVLLTSSDNKVAMPDSASITVSVGETVVTAAYTSDKYGPVSGLATITASASGLTSGYGQLTVLKNSSSTPMRLSLQPDPAVLIADGRTYSALTIMLLGANGSTGAAPAGGVGVQLTSSQPNVLQVPPTVLVNAGQTFALVPVTTLVSPGSSVITATASGLASASATIAAVAPAPSKLALYIAPKQGVVAEKESRALLYVQLQDDGGDPALARNATNVIITSSNSTLAGSALRLTIPVGEDYNVVPLSLVGNSEGTLTASTPGLRSATATLRSFLAPFQAAITDAAPAIFLNQTDVLTVSVYALGTPLKDVVVSWSASTGSFAPSSAATDSSGRTSTVFTPSALGPANILATLSSRALGQSNLTASILVIATPLRHDQTVMERLFSYWQFIAAAAGGGAVSLVVVLRRRRKGKEITDEGYESVPA